MKKILSIVIALTISISLLGQGNIKKKKSEYRYGSLKLFLVSNYHAASINNKNLLLKTPEGDMKQAIAGSFDYVPGLAFSYLYNLDAKEDSRDQLLWGVVFGLEAQTNGFQTTYKTPNDANNYRATDRYRATAISVPIYVKLGGRNLYRDQSYVTIGASYNYLLFVQNINTASWTDQRYSRLLTPDEKSNSAFSVFLGFNFNIYNIQLEYWPTNYINSEYKTPIENGVNAYPYSQVNFQNNIFIKTGMSIPMTRWLTSKNWYAEKVRRTFRRR